LRILGLRLGKIKLDPVPSNPVVKPAQDHGRSFRFRLGDVEVVVGREARERRCRRLEKSLYRRPPCPSGERAREGPPEDEKDSQVQTQELTEDVETTADEPRRERRSRRASVDGKP
jgi:hypothetical protein